MSTQHPASHPQILLTVKPSTRTLSLTNFESPLDLEITAALKAGEPIVVYKPYDSPLRHADGEGFGGICIGNIGTGRRCRNLSIAVLRDGVPGPGRPRCAYRVEDFILLSTEKAHIFTVRIGPHGKDLWESPRFFCVAGAAEFLEGSTYRLTMEEGREVTWWKYDTEVREELVNRDANNT